MASYEYKIASDDDLTKLETKLNDLAREGWDAIMTTAVPAGMWPFNSIYFVVVLRKLRQPG